MSWDRDKLLMELNAFTFNKRFKLGQEALRYLSFYHANLKDEIEGLDQRMGWVDSDEFRIVMQTYCPPQPRATVFIFHGYFDHAGIYQHLIRFLVNAGYAVVIYDMPGHGLSSGRPTAINSFSQYQRALDACLACCTGKLPQPFHAVGQSTGGAVLIDRLLHSRDGDESFDKIVLLAPLVRPVGWQSIARLHSLVKPFLKVWHRSFSQNSSDVQFVAFLKENDPLQSKWLAVDWIGALKDWIPRIESGAKSKRKILLVQGRSDKTVDWVHNIEVIRSLFQEVKVTYIEGGRHQLVNESPLLRHKVFTAMLSELSG